MQSNKVKPLTKRNVTESTLCFNNFDDENKPLPIKSKDQKSDRVDEQDVLDEEDQNGDGLKKVI